MNYAIRHCIDALCTCEDVFTTDNVFLQCLHVAETKPEKNRSLQQCSHAVGGSRLSHSWRKSSVWLLLSSVHVSWISLNRRLDECLLRVFSSSAALMDLKLPLSLVLLSLVYVRKIFLKLYYGFFLPSRLFTVSAEHHLRLKGFYSLLGIHVLARCRSSLKMYKIHGSLGRVVKHKVFKASAGEIKDKHAAFLLFLFDFLSFLSVFSFFFFFFLFFLLIVLFPFPSSLSPTPSWLSSCLSVSKASRRTHPSGPSYSWPWGSCCGCRRPPRPRSGCSSRDSSGCWLLRCHRPPSRTAGGWGSAPLRCSPAPPWRTGRIQSLCRNTGRNWTGSFGSGCSSRVAAGRCGI